MPLTANFLADFSSFINAAASATASTDELVEAAGKVGASMDAAVKQAAASLQTIGTSVADFGQKAWSVLNSSQLRNFASDVTTFASGFINEFAQAEESTARLTVALRNAGQASPEVIQAYGAMATELQHISRFSDEAITDAQTLFTTIGKIGPEAMEATLKATMDLARGMNVDLVTAANLVAKAAASDGEALGKLKLILGDSIAPGATFAEVLAAINAKFGGQALADMQTTAGTMENLKNQMSDINENIGKVFADTLKTIFDWFQKLPEGIQTFTIAAVAIGTALAPVLLSLQALVSLIGSSGLGAAVGAGATAIAEAIGITVGALAGWVVAIGAAAAAIYIYWDEIVGFFKWAYEKIKYFLVDALPAAFTSSIETVAKWYAAVKYWLQDQFTKVIDWVLSGVGKIADAFLWLYDQVVGFSSVPDLIDGIAAEFGRLDKVMIRPALAAVDDVNAAFANGISPLNLSGAALNAGRGSAGGVTVTVNMSGMLGADDPQTRALVSDLVSSAVMQGMRGGRLLGTA